MPDAGTLDRLLTIEERIERRDEYGEPSDDWSSTGDRVWCSVESLNASERVQGDRVRGILSHKITLRYRPDLTSKHRLVGDGRTFNIDGTREGEGRRQWTVVSAMEEGA